MTIEYIKQKCPSCGKMVNKLYSDPNKPGFENSCQYCITVKIRSLQQLNIERKNKHNKKI